MREIKFRIYDPETQMMVYSDKVYDDYSWGFEDGVLKCWRTEIVSATIDEPEYPIGVEVDGEIVQYTGLKDKNGVEIYEGDKIVVEGLEYVFHDIRKADSLREYCERGLVEIIGNIYENPELVK